MAIYCRLRGRQQHLCFREADERRQLRGRANTVSMTERASSRGFGFGGRRGGGPRKDDRENDAAGRWYAVAQLAKELEARRLHNTGKVVHLTKRAPRGGRG
jgi:hypothetical protein